MDFPEFLRISRHIETEFYHNEGIKGLRLTFEKYSEKDEDDDMIIDRNGFKQLCEDNELFSEEKQVAFSELACNTPSGKEILVTNIKELVGCWFTLVKPKIEKRYTMSNKQPEGFKEGRLRVSSDALFREIECQYFTHGGTR